MCPPPPHRLCTSISVIAVSCFSVNTAPLGSPVVPDVKTMATSRSDRGSSGAGVLAPERSSASTSDRSVMTSVGSTMATSVSCSATASLGLMPAVIAPIRAAPR